MDAHRREAATPPPTRSSRAVALAVGAALLALAAGGCARREPSPDAAYRAFARAAAEGEAGAAFGMLAPQTQAWLEARAKAAAAAAPGVVPADPRRLLLGDAAAAVRPLARVTVLRESKDRAVVRAEDQGGAAAEVELVRVGGGWRVILPPG